MSEDHVQGSSRRGHSESQSQWLREITRTATPATSIGDALAALEIVPKLHRGIRVLKIDSNGKMANRILTLSRQNFIVFVTPSKVPGTDVETASRLKEIRQRIRKTSRFGQHEHTPRYIDIADITHVQRGFIGTQKLENSKDRYLGKRTFRSSSKTRVDYLQNANAVVSIVYGGDRETLDLIIPDDRDRGDFLDALKRILDVYHKAKVHVGKEERLLRYVWYEIDINKNGRIDRKEVEKLLHRLNINKRGNGDSSIKKDYRNFIRSLHPRSTIALAKAYSRGLTYKECLIFLRQKHANCDTWDTCFGQDLETVSAEVFLEKFLHGPQREHKTTLADARTIFARLNAMEIGGERGCKDELYSIDRLRFEEYLRSDLNDVYDPESREFDHNTMGFPLSEYWISSSHNTYLTGDQLQSTSSVEMYMSALQRGCKCLELDCWDGEKEKGIGEMPVVYHGYTLTSKIKFADILQSVQAYIDEHPDTYPIILSLENHCSLPCQRRMASLLKEMLGERLYIPDGGSQITKDLPSPESLRGMVVIKGKRPPEPDDEDLSKEGEEEDYDPYDDAIARGGNDSDDVEATKAQISKVVPELARLTLFHGCKFEAFSKSISLSPSHMHSFNESKVTKILNKGATNADMWKKYNCHHLSRIYPAGSRVDSSNYSPVLPWSLGCQLVALNMQTADANLFLNDGLFRQNGSCGYVRKPVRLLAAKSSTTLLEDGSTALRIRIIRGSCLPKPKGRVHGEIIDPYVKIKLHDVTTNDMKGNGQKNRSFSPSSTPQRKTSHTTKFVLDNGFSPVWNDQWVCFQVHSDTALLQFSVRDKDISLDESIAEAAVPVACLRSGYRSVQLYSAQNTRSGPFDCSTLLIQVEYPAAPSLAELPLHRNPTPTSL